MTNGSTAVSHQPIDAVTERLNDPAIAASLVTLLDNAELLSMLVTGLNEFFERGDTIIESLASGIAEARGAAQASGAKFDVGAAVESAKSVFGTANQALPAVNRLLESGMLNDRLIDLLALVGDSAVEGAANARRNSTTIHGVRGALKALKDPEVARGLGLLVEISRSLGSRMGAQS